MILEVIVQTFFSGLGSKVFTELMNSRREKDEAKLRALIRHELEELVRSSLPASITINDAIISEIVQRVKATELPVHSATYKIVSVLSEKVLDVWGARTEDGVEIRQHSYHGGANQLWRLISVSRNVGTFKIVSDLSEKVLDVWGARTENGVEIRQYSYHGGANQLWLLIPVTSNGDTFKIVSQLSGKVLDVWGARTEDGVEIRQHSYHGGMNQHWRLTRVK